MGDLLSTPATICTVFAKDLYNITTADIPVHDLTNNNTYIRDFNNLTRLSTLTPTHNLHSFFEFSPPWSHEMRADNRIHSEPNPFSFLLNNNNKPYSFNYVTTNHSRNKLSLQNHKTNTESDKKGHWLNNNITSSALSSRKNSTFWMQQHNSVQRRPSKATKRKKLQAYSSEFSSFIDNKWAAIFDKNINVVKRQSDHRDEGYPILNLTEILGTKHLALKVVVPITIIYSIILITGLFGNLLTCAVIVKTSSMHTATNYYLFNLAIADLISLIIGMPQELYTMWNQYPYPFGSFMCSFRALVSEMTTYSSILCITAFTIERYFAICHPFYAHRLSDLRRVVKIICGIWVVACVNAIPYSLFTKVNYVCDFGNHLILESAWCGVPFNLPSGRYIPLLLWSAFAFLFVPMCILVILYIKIGLKLKRTANAQIGQLHLQPQRQQKRRRSSPPIDINNDNETRLPTISQKFSKSVRAKLFKPDDTAVFNPGYFTAARSSKKDKIPYTIQGSSRLKRNPSKWQSYKKKNKNDILRNTKILTGHRPLRAIYENYHDKIDDDDMDFYSKGSAKHQLVDHMNNKVFKKTKAYEWTELKKSINGTVLSSSSNGSKTDLVNSAIISHPTKSKSLLKSTLFWKKLVAPSRGRRRKLFDFGDRGSYSLAKSDNNLDHDGIHRVGKREKFISKVPFNRSSLLNTLKQNSSSIHSGSQIGDLNKSRNSLQHVLSHSCKQPNNVNHSKKSSTENMVVDSVYEAINDDVGNKIIGREDAKTDLNHYEVLPNHIKNERSRPSEGIISKGRVSFVSHLSSGNELGSIQNSLNNPHSRMFRMNYRDNSTETRLRDTSQKTETTPESRRSMFSQWSSNQTTMSGTVDDSLRSTRKSKLSTVSLRTRSEEKRIRSRTDAIKMLVAVVVAFFICWAPFNAQRLFFVFVKEWTPTKKAILEKLYNITGCLFYANSTLNPILYNVLSKRFRKAFMAIICPACISTSPTSLSNRKYRYHLRRGR